jgi:hypothetical protein
MDENHFAQARALARRGALALVCFITLVACGLGSAAQSSTTLSTPSAGQTATTGSPSGGGTSNGKPILWTHLAASNDRVLLYQRSSHTGKIAQINGSGALVVMKTYAGTMGDWTHIAAAGQDFVFYNRDTRAAAVAHVAADGSLVYVKTYAAGSLGDWTDITGVGKNIGPVESAVGSLVFYNRDRCTGDFVGLADDGTFPFQIEFDRATIPCATVVASDKLGGYVFYSSDTGVAYFANPEGTSSAANWTIHDIHGFGKWTHIVGTMYLLFFYNRANHQPYIGQWRELAFTNIRAYQAGEAPDFNLLAATSDYIVYYNNASNVHAGGVWKLNEDGTLTNATKF